MAWLLTRLFTMTQRVEWLAGDSVGHPRVRAGTVTARSPWPDNRTVSVTAARGRRSSTTS